LKENQRNALIQYRLEQAREALEEAIILKNTSHFKTSVNRSYYVMFYCLQALAIKYDMKISKHTGAISTFDREFVKKGIFDKERSRWLHKLFHMRNIADYGEFAKVTPDQSETAILHAKEFLSNVESFLRSNS